MNQHHIIQIKSKKHRLSLRFLDVSVEVRETQAMYDETFRNFMNSLRRPTRRPGESSKRAARRSF